MLLKKYFQLFSSEMTKSDKYIIPTMQNTNIHIVKHLAKKDTIFIDFSHKMGSTSFVIILILTTMNIE